MILNDKEVGALAFIVGLMGPDCFVTLESRDALLHLEFRRPFRTLTCIVDGEGRLTHAVMEEHFRVDRPDENSLSDLLKKFNSQAPSDCPGGDP